MASYLGMVDLGTLLKDGIEQPRPTKPWQINTTPPGASSNGNIADFSTLQDMSKWVIGDTSATLANKLRWHKIQDGNKTLLICDRMILVNVSWNDLNGQGFVTGKTITIDGQQYKLRLLTGGEEKREGGTGSSYAGGKLPNEWDSYIVNEAGMSGAPTPVASDLDNTADATDFSSAHNQAWNWYYAYSWCQETYKYDSAIRAGRGLSSARYWDYYVASSRYDIVGWRPALEILNSAPLISVIDATYPDVRFTVSDTDGTVQRVDVYLNDILKQTYNSGLGAKIVYTINYADLSEGDNTLEIVATDNFGGESVKLLNISKTDITVPTAETKVVIKGKQYTITDVVNDGVTLTLTLDRPLEENIVTNESVEVLNNYVVPSADLGSGFEELDHVKTEYVGDQALEKYELAAEGRTAIFKVNASKKAGSAMEISKPKAIFQYKED